jgi:hypothetical protein
MGLNFGGSSNQSSGASTSTPTYSGPQSSLQSSLLSAFQSILPGITSGGIGPNVQAVQTQNANTINKSYSSIGDRMNKFLAGRGFGQSGQSGQTALQTELGRQGALAQNDSNAAGLQLSQNSTWLADMFNAAFANPGKTATDTSSGSASNWGASGALAFGF